jgi:hypothetical protein
VNDPKLGEFHLTVDRKKQPGRSHGWAKLYGSLNDRHGAINIEWNGRSKTLLCRIVTKGQGKPHLIAGDLIDYLLARHRKVIRTVNIFPE